MKSPLRYSLTFNHNCKDFEVAITQYFKESSLCIYELRLKYLKYLLIYNGDEWEFVADIEPSRALKDVIIAAIIQKKPLLIDTNYDRKKIRLSK